MTFMSLDQIPKKIYEDNKARPTTKQHKKDSETTIAKLVV